MQFPHTYFEDEVREGFYITGMMKRAWAAQLEALEEIDKVCRKHNIRWFADCGTLLGAIRHGGYVPWDDDFDICMLRSDYIKFNEVAKDELPEGYVILNLNNEDEHYFEYLTRVSNGHRLNFGKEYLEKYHDCPFAAGVDVFPIDYVSDDEEEEEERKALATLVMAAADEIDEDNGNADNYKDVLSQIEEFCDVKIDYSRCIRLQLYQTAEKILSMYAYKGGKHVALMPYWIFYGNHLYPSEYFEKTIMVPFENVMLPVPAAYEGVLRIEYGDYMKLVKTGGVHGYPFFEGQEKHLKKLVSPYPFEYVFSPEDLDNSDRQLRPGARARQLTELMREAHAAIIAVLTIGRYDQARELLMSCQNSAIQIGTLLEESFGEGFEVVSVLETYCELLYQIGELAGEAEATGQNMNVGEIGGLLTEITEAYICSLKNNIPARREILFISHKACHWGTFEKAWREAKADENCDVYVMPVPYYSRTATGALGEQYYEGDQYPEYLDIIDYKDYDITKRLPDEVYIQDPYDGYNYTTTVDSCYFSSYIKHFTGRLVYIPWFILEEPEEENKKAKKVMDYYCRMPALAHSDEVLVQSAAMRESYIEYLTNFAGEETRKVWEDKIGVLETSLYDELCAENERLRREGLGRIPDNWRKLIYREDGNRRKILLYNTNVASIIQHGSAMLDKIGRSLDIIKNNSDNVVLLWRPHPLLANAIAATMPELMEDYRRLVQDYRDAGWGIFDDTQDSKLAVDICDAYYGDSDGMAHSCEALCKPVMLQSLNV